LRFATQPCAQCSTSSGPGAGRIDHPPLYEILLHFWLRLTGGTLESLRFRSILLYLAGLFLVARAAGRLGGPEQRAGGGVARRFVALRFSLRPPRFVVRVIVFLVAGLTLA